jgi:hypothetical protein
MVLINTPGYLSEDDEPPVFDTAPEAWQYILSEVERSWDEYPEDPNGSILDAHTQLHNLDQTRPGTIVAGTPGYDGSHDLGQAYNVVETVEPV